MKTVYKTQNCTLYEQNKIITNERIGESHCGFVISENIVNRG